MRRTRAALPREDSAGCISSSSSTNRGSLAHFCPYRRLKLFERQAPDPVSRSTIRIGSSGKDGIRPVNNKNKIEPALQLLAKRVSVYSLLWSA
jgi:hypothetical protein